MAAPNAQYPQGYYPPPPPQEYGQQSSSYQSQHRPVNYTAPPPHQPDPSHLGPHQQPLYPPAQSSYEQPPYPVQQPIGVPNANMAVVHQRQNFSEIVPGRPAAQMYPDGLRRASYTGSSHSRRHSHDSRRSHHSDRSHHSHHSRRARREDDDTYDDDEERPRHEHHHHHHHSSDDDHHKHHHHEDVGDVETYRQRKKEKGENVGRSWGGSLLSVLGPFKALIEPSHNTY